MRTAFSDQGKLGISPSSTRQTHGVISGLALIILPSASSYSSPALARTMNMATGENFCSGSVTDTIGASRGRLKHKPLRIYKILLATHPYSVDHRSGDSGQCAVGQPITIHQKTV